MTGNMIPPIVPLTPEDDEIKLTAYGKIRIRRVFTMQGEKIQGFFRWVKRAPVSGVAMLGAGFGSMVAVVVIVIVAIARAAGG
jgi:hypothetical protein